MTEIEKQEEEFPLSLKRKWKAPKLHFEFLWISQPTAFKELHASFRITPNLELVAVGDEFFKGASFRLLTLVFKEVDKPKPNRRAFSLKKQWELTPDGTKTLDRPEKGDSP